MRREALSKALRVLCIWRPCRMAGLAEGSLEIKNLLPGKLFKNQNQRR